MYQIKCDDYVLYDPRIDDLVLLNPKCKLAVNTVGEGSFTILASHPYYDKLKKLKSIFEISQDGFVIFRGRMTNDSRDFYNKLNVDLEGVLAYTNDTVIPPFKFPDDCPDATTSANIVEYFLGWILDQHNENVEDWKQLKVGTVTVSDPNNYITRSSDTYSSTWDTLKSKLFDSGLGGYLTIRYEDDGNYIDYVSEFALTNTQRITFGENLLDITRQSDATGTYSAIIPLGAKIDGVNLTIESLSDGELTDDLVKFGKYVYSKSAKAEYGWICVPPSEATWTDVTNAGNLQTKAVEYLSGTASLLSGTITIKALDLSFTDDQIQSFRVYRNILVDSAVHGVSGVSYPLTQMDIDILNPQNTTITIGDAVRTLVDINAQAQTNEHTDLESAKVEIQETKSDVTELKNQMVEQNTTIINSCSEIIMSALKDYVETSNFEQYKETVESQLSILADEITLNFTHTTENINNVAGDLQAEVTERKKCITFSQDGILIGSGENTMTLELDNDMIKFKRNGVQFGWWDGVDFHTGNIVVDVNERAQLGNFAFIPRSDGSLMFLKVGG